MLKEAKIEFWYGVWINSVNELAKLMLRLFESGNLEIHMLWKGEIRESLWNLYPLIYYYS